MGADPLCRCLRSGPRVPIQLARRLGPAPIQHVTRYGRSVLALRPRAVTQSIDPCPTVPNGRLAEQRSLKSAPVPIGSLLCPIALGRFAAQALRHCRSTRRSATLLLRDCVPPRRRDHRPRRGDGARTPPDLQPCSLVGRGRDWWNPPLHQPAILGRLLRTALGAAGEGTVSEAKPVVWRRPQTTGPAPGLWASAAERLPPAALLSQDLKPAEPCPRATWDRTPGIPHRPRPGRRGGPSPWPWDASHWSQGPGPGSAAAPAASRVCESLCGGPPPQRTDPALTDGSARAS